MRRHLLLTLGVVAVAGCSNVRDIFTAHADVAATAGGQTLTTDRLALLLSSAKGVQLTPQAAEFVANIWVDYSLFAQAVTEGKLTADSAQLAEIMWPEIADIKQAAWYDRLAEARQVLSPGAVEAAYAADTARALQHILFGVSPNDPGEKRVEARRNAERTLGRIRAGADFGTLAGQLSDDPGSRANRGLYPPAARGQYVTAFDSAGWALAPGQVSGVVETPYGFHIIKRPTLAEVHDVYRDWLSQVATRQLDSTYMENLAEVNHVKVAGNAPELMRAAVRDRQGMRESTKKLATYDRGEFTVQEFLRWMSTPQMVPLLAQVSTVEDEQLTSFARALTTNEVLLRQADSAGITLSEVEWQTLRQRFATQLDTIRAAVGLNSDVTDSTVALEERRKVAELKVTDFFDRLVSGRAQLRPLPSTLADELRGQFPARVNTAGLTRALELAQATADSLKTGGGAGPAGPGLRPAPGPAPVPGATPAP